MNEETPTIPLKGYVWQRKWGHIPTKALDHITELEAEKLALELLCEGKELSKDELRQKIKELEAEVRNAKQQGSLENTHDMIELLEAYVLCPEEELTEDAIKTIREPIIKVLRTKWNMEVTKVSDSVGKEYVVYSYQDNLKDRKEK